MASLSLLWNWHVQNGRQWVSCACVCAHGTAVETVWKQPERLHNVRGAHNKEKDPLFCKLSTVEFAFGWFATKF